MIIGDASQRRSTSMQKQCLLQSSSLQIFVYARDEEEVYEKEVPYAQEGEEKLMKISG
jgi:hypothetical protein